MRSMRFHHLLFCMLFVALVLLGAVHQLLAAANISVSYSSTMTIPPDSLVSTQAADPSRVELANLGNASQLIGVAVSSNQSILAINTTNNTQVAVSGTVEVSASTINGNIHIGDPISASAIDGVGMKADKGDKTIGLAQSALNAQTPDAATLDVNGATVYLGHVTVSIASSGFNASQTQNQTGFLSVINNAASTVSGHHVSDLQAVLGFIVTLVALLMTTALVYATIRGGVISLGRNPLARSTIFHSIEELMALIPVVVVIAIVVLYFILR